MKCWECKKEILEAHRVPYVAINKVTGEPYAEKFRDVGLCCYLMVKAFLNETHHVEVEKLSHRKLNRKGAAITCQS